MAVGFKFEKLIIWQKAMDFGEEIHGLANTFPATEPSDVFEKLYNDSFNLMNMMVAFKKKIQ